MPARDELSTGSAKVPVLAGIIVFVAGFGALNLFWLLGEWPRDVKGLWDFRSVIIGDSLLLPLAAGVLVASASRLPVVPRERLVVACAGGFGLISGTLLQLAWLRDPNPSLNWTLPAPHTFNAAGIYHALFLIAICAFFSAWTMLVLWRYRHLRSRNPERVEAMLSSPWSALAITCLVAFTGLLAIDNYPTEAQTASLATVVLSLAALLLTSVLLAWSFGGQALLRAWRTVIYAAFLSLAVCAVAWRPEVVRQELYVPELLVVGAATLSIGAQLWEARDRFWLVRTTSACLFVVAGLSYAMNIASSDHPNALFVASIVALVFVLLVGLVMSVAWGRQRQEARQLALATLCSILILVIAGWNTAAADRNEASSLLDLIWTLLPILVIFLGKSRYDLLIDAEDELGSGRELERHFFTTWATMLGALVAIAIASLQSVAELPFNMGGGAAPGSRLVVLLIGALATGLLCIMAVRTGRQRISNPAPSLWREEAVIQPTIWTMLLALLASVAWAASPWLATMPTTTSSTAVSTAGWSTTHLILVILAAIIGLWLLYFTVNSIWSNVAYQEFHRLGWRAWLVLVFSGLAGASAVGWLWSVGVLVRGDWARLDSIASTVGTLLLGNVIAAMGTGWVLHRSKPPIRAEPAYLSLHHPVANVFHDQILHGFTLAIAVLVVFLADTVTLWVLAVALVAVVGFVVVGHGYTTSNFSTHLENERKRGSPEDNTQLPEVMLIRAGGDIDEANELHEARIRRLQKRFERIPLEYLLGSLLARAISLVGQLFSRR